MKRCSHRSAVLAALLATALSGGLTVPDARAQARDHDRAQSAVRSGQVLPLKHILASLGRRYHGRVLDVQLREDASGVWRYDVKLLDDSGKVASITVDASSGRILNVR